jgi:hypothetical protein
MLVTMECHSGNSRLRYIAIEEDISIVTPFGTKFLVYAFGKSPEVAVKNLEGSIKGKVLYHWRFKVEFTGE